MGQTLRSSISSAAQSSESAVSAMLRRVTASAQRASASMQSAARPRASSVSSGGDTDSGSKGGKSGGGGMLGNVVAGAAGGAIVAGAIALKGYASAALDAAGRINDLRAATGANAKVIQTWEAIVTQAGGSPETLEKGLKGLNKALSDASKGNKDAVGAFRELGVATKNTDGSARSLGTILREAGGALGNIEDASKKAALAQTLFGKAGFDLLPAFEGGTAAVDAQVESFSKLAALNDEQVTKLDATGDSLDTFKLKLAGLGAKALTAFGPLIDVIATTAMPLIESLANAVTPLIEAFAAGLKPVLESLAPVFEQVFGVLGPVIQQLAPIFEQLIAKIAPLIPLLASSLVPVIVALAPAFVQLASAIMPLVQQLLPPMVELIQMLAPIVLGLAVVLSGMLGPAIGIVSSAISVLIGFFSGAIKTVKLVAAAFQFLWSIIFGGPAAVDEAGKKLMGSLDEWWQSIAALGAKIEALFAGIWNGIVDTFKGAASMLGIGDGASAKLTVAHQGGPFAGAQTKLPGSTVNNTTTNSTTLEDKRQISVLVQRDATPTQTANAAASALGGVLDVDRRRIGESMSPGSG